MKRLTTPVWIAALLAVVILRAQAQEVMTNDLNMTGHNIYSNTVIPLASSTNTQDDADTCHFVPTVGQMYGIDPDTGDALDNGDLLTLKPQAFSLETAGNRVFVIRADQIAAGGGISIGYDGSNLVISVDTDNDLDLGTNALTGVTEIEFDNGETALSPGTTSHSRFSGSDAGYLNTGDSAVGLGQCAAQQNSGDYVMGVGYRAAQQNSGANVVAAGREAAKENSANEVNALGHCSARGNSGSSVNAFGYSAGKNNEGAHVNALGYCAALGNDNSHVNALGNKAAYNNSGGYVNGIGCYAADGNNGNYVNAIGVYSARDNYTGPLHAFGYQAGEENLGADVFVAGWQAGLQNSGDRVVGIGRFAADSATGDDIVAFGRYSAQNNAGNNCFFVGEKAGQNNTANNVIAIGEEINGTNLVAYSSYLDGNLRLQDCNGKGGGTELHFANGAGLTTTSNAFDLGACALVIQPQGDVEMGIYTNTP